MKELELYNCNGLACISLKNYNAVLEEVMRLYSIIKEVRELLKNDYFEDGSFTTEKRVFELLDKVEEKENE